MKKLKAVRGGLIDTLSGTKRIRFISPTVRSVEIVLRERSLTRIQGCRGHVGPHQIDSIQLCSNSTHASSSSG